MRTLSMVTSAILALAALPANAQQAPQTLDGQLRKLEATGQVQPHSPTRVAPAEAIDSQPVNSNGTVYQSLIDSQGNGAIPALPLDVMTNGTVTYVSGGISDEEMAMLKSRASEFNLHVNMNTVGGAFMVTSKFHVLDANNAEVLRIEDAGPSVYAHLPAGKYTVEAVEGSEIKAATVNVPAKGAVRTQLTFKQ